MATRVFAVLHAVHMPYYDYEVRIQKRERQVLVGSGDWPNNPGEAR
jgi:hypothetical protein